MTQEKTARQKRVRWTISDGKLRWLLIIGLAGMLLIGLTECFPGRKSSSETGEALSAVQVEQALENRIGDLLGQVEGVGECQVMVTLESSVRFQYAKDISGDSEQTLMVETDSGPVGLSVTEIQPSVKGVAVICAGGGDPAVRERVSDLVTTVFSISGRRVSVAKLKE